MGVASGEDGREGGALAELRFDGEHSSEGLDELQGESESNACAFCRSARGLDAMESVSADEGQLSASSLGVKRRDYRSKMRPSS